RESGVLPREPRGELRERSSVADRRGIAGVAGGDGRFGDGVVSRLSAEDKLAIHELLACVAWAYDEARLDLMEDCFTEAVQMRLRIAGGDVIGPYEGRDAVLALNRDAIASQSDQRRH